MENTENQEVKSNSSRLRDRYSKKYPDKVWEGDNAETDDSVAGLAADEIDEFEKDKAAREAFDEKMNGMFRSNRRGARAFMNMADGTDPVVALLEEFGPDLAKAWSDEEGQEKYKELIDKWKQQELDNEADDEEFNNNLESTSEAIIAFADSHGMSDDEINGLVSQIRQWAEDFVKGIVSVAALNAAYKGGKYDNDVASAREEGEVNGRNARIKETLRQSKESPTKLPPTVSSGDSDTENDPKARRGSLSMFGGIPVRKK